MCGWTLAYATPGTLQAAMSSPVEKRQLHLLNDLALIAVIPCTCLGGRDGGGSVGTSFQLSPTPVTKNPNVDSIT